MEFDDYSDNLSGDMCCSLFFDASRRFQKLEKKMNKVKFYAIMLAFLAGACVLGYADAQAAKVVGDPQSTASGGAPANMTGGGAPALTELEKLRIENIGLKNTIISLQKSLLQAQAQLVDKGGDAIKEVQNALVLDVQKAHPGYTLNGDGALVAIPAPKK